MKRKKRNTKRTKRAIRAKKSSAQPNTPNYALFAAAAIVFIFAAGAIFSLINSFSSQRATKTIDIYYFDAAAMSLKPETRSLTINNNKDIVKFALEELAIGPKSVALSPSVPPELIKSATISGTNVEILTTNQYDSLNPDQEIICRSALAYTLTNLDFIDSITINVNGKELAKTNGQPFGKIKLSDIVLEPVKKPGEETPRTIDLYFADTDMKQLEPENRTILANPDKLMAEYIVEELIKGPALPDLVATIPPETVLLDISISEGICHVDLSKEFVTRHTDSMPSEQLSVYSIVNSLSAQGDIKKVQFYIEGERLEQFKSITDFSNLFEAKAPEDI